MSEYVTHHDTHLLCVTWRPVGKLRDEVTRQQKGCEEDKEERQKKKARERKRKKIILFTFLSKSSFSAACSISSFLLLCSRFLLSFSFKSFWLFRIAAKRWHWKITIIKRASARQIDDETRSNNQQRLWSTVCWNWYLLRSCNNAELLNTAQCSRCVQVIHKFLERNEYLQVCSYWKEVFFFSYKSSIAAF